MKFASLMAPSAALLCIAAGSALPQQVLDSYEAVIGPEDRRNSQGTTLLNIETMIQQDRANFHRFGIRHPGDTSDTVFSSRAVRGQLAAFLRRGGVSPEARLVIESGSPAPVTVEILGFNGVPNAVHVSLGAGTETARARAATAFPAPEQFREAQRSLADLGYYSGALDGEFGPMSRAALEAFRAARGLPRGEPLTDRDLSSLRDAQAAIAGAAGVTPVDPAPTQHANRDSHVSGQLPSFPGVSIAQTPSAGIAPGDPAPSQGTNNQNFRASGRISHLPGADDAQEVFVWTEGEKAFVDYPDLGCSGALIPAYNPPGGLLSGLRKDDGMGFSEILWGPKCGAAGTLAIVADGYGGWMLERRFDGTRTWRGAAEIEIGSATRMEPTQPIPTLPPGTVAGDAELGLFLGEGPGVPGVGPTSRVTGVAEGSLAAVFGVKAGDTVLWVDQGASMPAGHIQMMRAAFSDRGSVEVRLRDSSGQDRTVLLHSPDAPFVKQLAKAAREDEFGSPRGMISTRLRLMADGAFEALDALAAQDDLANTASDFVVGSVKPPYATLIANYANARLHFLGDCGDAVTTFSDKRGGIWETSRGGVIVDTDDQRYILTFDVLARFAHIIAAVDPHEVPGEPGRALDVLASMDSGWSRLIDEFEEPLARLTCDSEGRKRLEDNMMAYYRGDPPHHLVAVE